MHNHHFYILFVIMTFMMTSCKTTDFVSEETIDTKNEVSKIINFNKNNKELGEFLNNHNFEASTTNAEHKKYPFQLSAFSNFSSIVVTLS